MLYSLHLTQDQVEWLLGANLFLQAYIFIDQPEADTSTLIALATQGTELAGMALDRQPHAGLFVDDVNKKLEALAVQLGFEIVKVPATRPNPSDN